MMIRIGIRIRMRTRMMISRRMRRRRKSRKTRKGTGRTQQPLVLWMTAELGVLFKHFLFCVIISMKETFKNIFSCG